MRTIGQARRDFKREGFAVISRVFSAAECAALLEETNAMHVSAASDAVRVKNLSVRQRAGVTRAQAGEEIFIIGDLPRQSPRLARLLADRRVIEMTAGVLGGAGLVYYFSNLTHKAARSTVLPSLWRKSDGPEGRRGKCVVD